MKSVYGVSIWYWVAMIFLVGCGAYWMMIGRKTPKPSEDAVNCYAAAIEMLMFERMKILGGASSADDRRERTKDAGDRFEKSNRSYEKLLARLEQNEGMLSRESSLIEERVTKGKALNARLPKNAARLQKLSSEEVAKLDKEWELFLETDLVDVLQDR